MSATPFDLKPNQELRFQVGEESVKLELRRGLAEVYGTEMLLNKTYTFPRRSKAAVFTYQGATIEMTGSPLKSYICQKCDHMLCYLSIHGDLEKMREESEQMKFPEENSVEPSQPDLSKTPICLVCKPRGATNTGKSKVCKILLNYAARRGRAPIFVDLDPSDRGHIGLPGTIGALSIESPIDIETGLPQGSSMLMHFGHLEPSIDNEGNGGLLYKALIENMARAVHSKLAQDKKSFHSGVIINTCAWSDVADYKLLLHACKVFQANTVLVIDFDGLQVDLEKDLSDCGHPVTVLNVPRTVSVDTGVFVSNVELRQLKIKEYFYGTQVEAFNPMTIDKKFSVIKRLIYRVGNQLMLPSSLMPLGTNFVENSIKVSHYDCTASDLLHHILAISYCKIDDIADDPDIVLRTNIKGFICITSVRSKPDGDIVSILAPQKLPMDHVLLYSDVQYMDSL